MPSDTPLAAMSDEELRERSEWLQQQAWIMQQEMGALREQKRLLMVEKLSRRERRAATSTTDGDPDAR